MYILMFAEINFWKLEVIDQTANVLYPEDNLAVFKICDN